MTGSSDSDKIVPDRANTAGRLLFGAALIFAVGATLTLVFATSAQWLKLAVIAALWAAFFGAMLSVKYRHLAAARAGEVADLQAVYELELEREVAARREYELEVEADTRRRIAEEAGESSHADIAALRAELHALRENLDRLTGGEVLVERIALRAQSTRMRSIGDPMAARAIANAPGQGRVIGAALEPSTQLLEPVQLPRPQRPDQSRRVGPQRPDGQRPDSQRSGGNRPDSQRGYRPDGQSADGARPRRDEPERRPEPAWVPTQSTGEQSRSNLRREPVNPPMPRQPGNTGVQPIIARPSASTGAQPSIGRPAAGNNGGTGNDPASESRWTDEDAFEQGGRHGSGSYQPVPRPGGRRAEPEPAGAHAAGRSVTELLAAHRSAEDGPRRHRRRAD